MYGLCESAIIYFYTVEGRSCVDVYRKQDEYWGPIKSICDAITLSFQIW